MAAPVTPLMVWAMTLERGRMAGWLAMVVMGLALNLMHARVLAEPQTDWVFLQRSEVDGNSRWGKRLSLSDNGFPVVLIEERSGSNRQTTSRYLVTVDCKNKQQGLRQFWQRGEANWQVIDPLEWQPADMASARQSLELACGGAIRR